MAGVEQRLIAALNGQIIVTVVFDDVTGVVDHLHVVNSYAGPLPTIAIKNAQKFVLASWSATVGDTVRPVSLTMVRDPEHNTWVLPGEFQLNASGTGG